MTTHQDLDDQFLGAVARDHDDEIAYRPMPAFTVSRAREIISQMTTQEVREVFALPHRERLLMLDLFHQFPGGHLEMDGEEQAPDPP
jgi:hypothetical protein